MGLFGFLLWQFLAPGGNNYQSDNTHIRTPSAALRVEHSEDQEYTGLEDPFLHAILSDEENEA